MDIIYDMSTLSQIAYLGSRLRHISCYILCMQLSRCADIIYSGAPAQLAESRKRKMAKKVIISASTRVLLYSCTKVIV